MGRMKELMFEQYDDELANLPEEAFEPFAVGCEIDKHWLETASAEDQQAAMYGWFKRNYYYPNELLERGTLPAQVYANGGPCMPEEVLRTEFGKWPDQKILAEVIAEIEQEAADGWVPTPYRPDDDYDEDFGVEVEDAKQPFTALSSRLDQIRELLTLTGSGAGTLLAQRLAYSAVITALESYLWETMTYAVDNDPKVVKNIITKFDHFSKQNLPLGAIYVKMDALESMVKGYLQNTVWHRWDDVKILFERALGITPPPFTPFDEPTVKRHDIIHRSGQTKDGAPITVTAEDAEELMIEVTGFAIDLEAELVEHYVKVHDALIEAELDSIQPNQGF